MKKNIVTFFILSVVASLAFMSTIVLASTPDLAGEWTCCRYGGPHDALVIAIKSGTSVLQGTLYQIMPPLGEHLIHGKITGSIKGDDVKIIVTEKNGAVNTFTGKLLGNGNTLSGSWEKKGSSNSDDRGKSVLKRISSSLTPKVTENPKPIIEKMEPVIGDKSEPVLRIIDFKNINDKNKKLGQPSGPAKLEYFRDGKWQRASVDTTLRIGDKLRTDDTTIAVFEFLIGGRVGINKGVEIEITGDRSIKEGVINVKKEIGNIADIIIDILHPAGLGQKYILEVQMNGGAMSIKG